MIKMISHACFLTLATVASQGQTIVIGGDTGNGDFSAGGDDPGTQTHSATDHWFNAQGFAPDEEHNLTFDSQAGGAGDPSEVVRAAMVFNLRTMVNDMAYTVTSAGEKFTLSYAFGAGGNANNWLGTEVMESFLFTLPEGVVVDGELTQGQFDSETEADSYTINRALDGQWTNRVVDDLYTTTADDIGKTFYLGMRFNGGGNLFPRVDLVNLQVVQPILDPSISALTLPPVITVESPSTAATSSFTIHNASEASALSVGSIGIAGGEGFTVVSPVGSFEVAPEGDQLITIQWDSTATAATYEKALLTINSNDTENPAFEVAVDGGIATAHADVVANGDFETPGTDTINDTDTFASWVEVDGQYSTPDRVVDVPGLLAGSETSAFLNGAVPGETPLLGSVINGVFSTPLNNFVLNCDFAISPGGDSVRKFAVLIAAEEASGEELVIRYQGGNFQARPNEGQWITVLDSDALGGPLGESIDVNGDGNLDDPGDSKIVYKLQLTSSGWGTSNPSSVLQISDSAGTVLATSDPFSIWRFDPPTAGDAKADLVSFSAAYGNAPSSWVDNVSVSGHSIDTDVPPPADSGFTVSAFSIDVSTGVGSITFGPTQAGLSYSLEASNDLGMFDPFVEIFQVPGSADATTYQFTDEGAVGQPHRSYRLVEPE